MSYSGRQNYFPYLFLCGKGPHTRIYVRRSRNFEGCTIKSFKIGLLPKYAYCGKAGLHACTTQALSRKTKTQENWK